jgi:hypothetical protein
MKLVLNCTNPKCCQKKGSIDITDDVAKRYFTHGWTGAFFYAARAHEIDMANKHFYLDCFQHIIKLRVMDDWNGDYNHKRDSQSLKICKD